MTTGSWFFEYEKAPYPDCHENRSIIKCFWLIQPDDSCFTIFIKSDIDWLDRSPNNIWIWSGIPFICNILWPLFCITPVIYSYNSFFHCFLNEALSVLNGKYHLDMNLCAGVGHNVFSYTVPDGTGVLFKTFFYQYAVPDGTGECWQNSWFAGVILIHGYQILICSYMSFQTFHLLYVI